jgi:hypothetical protein
MPERSNVVLKFMISLAGSYNAFRSEQNAGKYKWNLTVLTAGWQLFLPLQADNFR